MKNRRVLKGFLIFALLVSLVGWVLGRAPSPTRAGAITNLTVSAASPTKSATTTYTISFTIATKIPKTSGRINLDLRGPYWDYNFNSATVDSGTSPSGLSMYNRWWNGFQLSTSADIAAGSAITLKIGNVVNPSKGGYYFAHVWTADYSTNLDGSSDWGGDYNSAYFEIGTTTNVKGKITDDLGAAVPNANVNIATSNWSTYFYTYTDKNGDYGFGDVTAGTYNFDIYSPSTYSGGKTYFPPNRATITVTDGVTTTKNASFLATTKTLSGKVTKNTSTGTAVTDANISVWKNGGNGWAQATTDSSGNYSFSLTGGTWGLSVYPKTWPADWTYSTYNETMSFADDATQETKTKNFIVEALSSTITGTIQKPDGTAPTKWSVGLSFSNSKNQWFSAQMNDDGSFSAKVTAGTYTISGWVSDNSFAFPEVANFSVDNDATKALGIIKLVEKKDTISGTIKDNTGGRVTGASVSAWKSGGGYDWGNATSDSNGAYTIKVTPGTWQVSAWPQWKENGYDHVYSGKPASVTVTSGVPATKDFTFQKVTATIKGTVTDPDGNVLSSCNSWVSANDGSQEWSNIGASMTNGTFNLRTPAGTWTVTVYAWGCGDYSTPDPQKVTIADNETKSITIKMVKNDATITGTVYDDKGAKVTNTWMSIYATKGKYGSWQSSNFDTATATYSIKVSAGIWNLGWWIDQNLGYSSGNGQDVELDIKSAETKIYDINLKKADSTISGKATKDDGTAMQWAWITADTRDPNEKKEASTYWYSNGASSNNNGEYTLKIPAGTYWVGANMWPGSGYINPKRQKVTVDAKTPATVNLTFRKADATINGKITKDGSGTNAFVSAWSEDGGYSETSSNNEGVYGLSVSKGTQWHLTAVKQIDKEIWKSKETVVDMTDTKEASKDLELLKQTYSLPNTQTVTFDPSKQQTINLSDGTTISAPANSITTQSGNVTLTAEPTAELAQEPDAKPIAYGYELNVTDSTGKAIDTFNSNVTLETKYEDTWVSDSKVMDENELILGYYDKSAGTWKELDSCTINEDENSVTCQVNHFTKFALVAASDTTAPGAPTNQKAVPADAKTALSWTNPSDADLKGINIYRSTASGQLGSKIHSQVTGTSKEDTGLTNGTTYYYTLKSADASGNESTNTAQLSAKPDSSYATTAASLPKTGYEKPSQNPAQALILLVALGVGARLLAWSRLNQVQP